VLAFVPALGNDGEEPDEKPRPGEAVDVGYTGRDGYDDVPLVEPGSDRGDEPCTDGRVEPCMLGVETPRVADGAAADGRDELGMLGRLAPTLGRLLPRLLGRLPPMLPPMLGRGALDARGAEDAGLGEPPRCATAGRLISSRAHNSFHGNEVRFMRSGSWVGCRFRARRIPCPGRTCLFSAM
jgi:hypothetical protein